MIWIGGVNPVFGSATEIQPDRAPDMLIGPPDDPYMMRWWMIPRNDQFNIYYHRILHDDDDRALHDHPWPSFSIMCRGALREVLEGGGSREIRAGQYVYRGPNFAHRLELIGGEPAETIFITGPRMREWGFHCPNGWRHWKEFTDPSSPGEIGRGCGD